MKVKKYTVMLRGHITVFADSEKKAFEIADKQIEPLHPKYNLSTHDEL